MSVKLTGMVRMRNLVEICILLGVFIALSSADLLITRHPKTAVVLEQRGFVLYCVATGKPKPRVRWFHNGELMPRIGQNYRISNTRLRFSKIRVTDRGSYFCKVESGKETLTSKIAELEVQADVEIIYWSPSSGITSVKKNDRARLSCKAAGIPDPVIEWRKNGITITDEIEAGVRIESTPSYEGRILKSVLITQNLTETTKFECHAVNVNIGGPTVSTKFFDVFVLPEEDTSKRAQGICTPYKGSVCKSVLGERTVYFNLTGSNTVEHHERMAAELLHKLTSVDTLEDLKQRCEGHAQKLICNYIFPPCEEFNSPKPVPLCRESCTAVQQNMCYVQWQVVQQSNTDLRLPDCDSKMLISKWEEDKVCTEADIFAREEKEVTADCYVDRGRWYNGTVNVTRSGKPCQHWHLNEPQTHKRPPEVFSELENAENYCRNPGAEEDSPWCYIAIDKIGLRWEPCDIPQCSSEEKVEERTSMSWPTVLIVTIVSSCGVLIIAVAAVFIFIILSRRRRAIQYKNTPQDDLEIDIQKLPANMSYHCVEEPVRLNPKLEAYEYPRNDVIYIKDIGQGAFGRVFKARAPNLTKDAEATLIAVKMLKDDASDDLQADFEREASLMAEFDHPNIVKFYGVCAIGKPMCLLFEYMTKGDLNDYLRMSSPDQFIVRKKNIDIYCNEISSLDTIDQLNIAHQIAAGMVYLSEKCYVHRDLATRNCLITDNLTVKISDFGLARSVHRLEYYKGSDNDAIPIRWMPLESILYNKFSVESDVWSFGVILWEIFSFALQPYYGMTHEEVVEYLKEGKNLVCPERTPQQVYDLMLKCWNRKPNYRPKFHALHSALTALHDELAKKRLKETSVV